MHDGEWAGELHFQNEFTINTNLFLLKTSKGENPRNIFPSKEQYLHNLYLEEGNYSKNNSSNSRLIISW